MEFSPTPEEQRILNKIERYKPFRQDDQALVGIIEDIEALQSESKGVLWERLSECIGTESCIMG